MILRIFLEPPLDVDFDQAFILRDFGFEFMRKRPRKQQLQGLWVKLRKIIISLDFLAILMALYCQNKLLLRPAF
jgi:hypothetical protein